MLPEGFLRRMRGQLGDEYDAFLRSFDRPRAVALRRSPGKRAALPFACEPVPWEPAGFYYAPDARPGLHPYHDAGVYYLQEASAMAPVALLDPRPGELVCDLCAAPGGKSTQIAARMAGRGLLLCNEIHPKRAAILSRNIERMGVGNALVTNETPARLAARFPGAFDRVLVDAPCSGEGMFRKEEAAVADWSEETVAMCARRQAEILDAGAALVRPGGRIVYSTCTFAPEEDETAVERFLRRHPEFTPEAVDAPWFTPTAPGCVRLWPHRLRGEGHFAAVLRRDGGADGSLGACAGTPLPKVWHAFAADLGIALPEGKAIAFGEQVCFVPPEMPDLRALKVLRPGLELGKAQKGRFVPAHALAMWLPAAAVTQDYPAQSPETAAFLHGDTVPSAQTGWCLVTVDGCGLGWGKGDGTQLKNHYPKGLRR